MTAYHPVVRAPSTAAVWTPICGRARQTMESAAAQLAVYNTTSSQDIVFGLGLGCRGVVKILVEPVADLSWLRDETAVEFEGALGTRVQAADFAGRPRILETATGHAFPELLEAPQPLLIFEAGADAVPLAQIGELLGWQVQAVDPRVPHGAARFISKPSSWRPKNWAI